MKTYIFLYDEVPLCEVLLASSLGGCGHEVEIVSEKCGTISTCEGMLIAAYTQLSGIEIEKEDTFLLCGGDMKAIENLDALKVFLSKAHEKGVLIGGICEGADITADALQYEYSGESTEVFSERVVLAPGNDYAGFAQEFGRIAGLYSEEGNYQQTVRYFRNSQIDNSKTRKKDMAKVS